MEALPTSIHVPAYLPFPLRITTLLVTPETAITRGTALCDYSFQHKERVVPKSPGGTLQELRTETRYGRWECPIEGIFHRWLVRPGDIVTAEQAAKNPAAMVLEECTHSTQIHGMCAICGKDMTDVDYLGFSDASRASIRMTYDANGPTVSMEEALRYDQETSRRLLDERKLSLIVDLDQTIVHATVDPTVGEWMDEAERFESQRSGTAAGEDIQHLSDDDINPNWAALKNVKKFKLGGEGQSLPSSGHQEDGSYYYIKPRPGLDEFLNELKTKYEMHVYTMGTRAYAYEVCKAIDPDQSIFGGRILTRDESGSMTAKNLQRLFPSDQSMVAIIDDRSDVWSDVSNLVKVIPYDFFVGIGDINSAHLAPLVVPPGSLQTPLASAMALPSPSSTLVPSSPAASEVTQASPDVEGTAAVTAATKDAEDAVFTRLQSAALEAVVELRPLAKMQEQADAEEEKADSAALINGKDKTSEAADDSSSTTTPPPKIKHKMLLHNNDHELDRIKIILNEAHRRFYEAYGKSEKNMPRKTDLREFIEAIKAETFNGFHFTFSNIFPNNIDPRGHPIWRQSAKFGAVCHTSWNETITHVVALKLRSEKTKRGEHKSGVHVLHPQWLWDCITYWRRIPEANYVEMLRATDAAEIQAEDDQVRIPSNPQTPQPSGARDVEEGSHTSPSTATESLNEPSQDLGADKGEPSAPSPDVIQPFELDSIIDWNAVDDEVDAFLNESEDDEDGDASDSSMQSGTSRKSSLARKKRRRSPSAETSQQDVSPISSPLSKRLKLSQDRQGRSGLKVEVFKESSNKSETGSSMGDDTWLDGEVDTAQELRAEQEEDEEEEENMQDATDDEEGEEDEDEDFLARDLGWG